MTLAAHVRYAGETVPLTWEITDTNGTDLTMATEFSLNGATWVAGSWQGAVGPVRDVSIPASIFTSLPTNTAYTLLIRATIPGAGLDIEPVGVVYYAATG